MSESPRPLIDQMSPCGPVVDPRAAERGWEPLAEAAANQGWSDLLDRSRAALTPVFAASPYLTSICRRWPERLRRTLETVPEVRLEQILAAADALDGPPDDLKAPLRELKAELHLLTALADLGGVWDLDAVTGALSRFADAVVRAALRSVATFARARGRLLAPADGPEGPIPGLFGLAMGKHGAHELNYSSDIDLSLFYEPAALAGALADGIEPQGFADRSAQRLAVLLSERTAEGYVFRVDLRLRPDPSSTPPVVAAPEALTYYESVGQNWERAAFIKSRPVCGDLAAANAFLAALRPFIWRRSLDYQAVSDIHSIKRQIHVHKTGEGLSAAGANLKLGRGGIREIEFFAQTQQLILGGRDPVYRAPRTLDALGVLVAGGHLDPKAAEELSAAYVRLRALEHRVQMLADEQTHTLPADPERRAAVAALAGEGDLEAFDAGVENLLLSVNRRYGELFAEEEPLSSSFGSLVFTGVENDPETLQTLSRMGFDNPDQIAATIRGWHHGRIGATRTARGRELFTRLAPRLLDALARTGAPNAAFARFSVFFAGLSAGVQVQALFLAQPDLFDMIVEVMAFAPRLAATLGRNPAALDGVLDARFHRPVEEDSGICAQIVAEAGGAPDFEEAMNIARRIHREQAFRIGMHVMTGRAEPEEAGRAYADLADACIQGLARASLREAERQAGVFPGDTAVIALGKAGSREMTAGSDLDLMTVYAGHAPDATSARRGWSADVFYGRFTQRLIAALSSQTAEGGLYEVDMRLRPSGSAGPVAVALSTFVDYYAREAETWEFMVLSRARVVWASDPAFGEAAQAAVEAALRRPRDPAATAQDVGVMRELMARERRVGGFWDLKLSPGGQVDCEFAAQLCQLIGAPKGEPLTVSTLEALRQSDADPALGDAWRLQQAINQILQCAIGDTADPDAEPSGFQARLAAAGGAADFETLKSDLAEVRARARAAFEAMVS